MPSAFNIASYAFITLFTASSSSVPIGGPTEPVYVRDPSGRGTVGLLTSCIFTLTLCVWTALHLNIFPEDTSWRQRMLHKSIWAALALFAPEDVLWRAVVQWESARKLCDARNAVLDKAMENPPETTNDETVVAATDCDPLLEVPPATDTSPAPASTNGTDVEKNKRNRWCIEHGFYALMGGYVVSVKKKMSGFWMTVAP